MGQATASNVGRLEAVKDRKLLTLKVPGHYLSLLKILRFHRLKTSLAFDVPVGTNVEQRILFRMTSRGISVVPENLEIFHFSIISRRA